MGFISKFLKIAIVLSFAGFIYRFIGLNWAIISLVLIISLYILYRIAKRKGGWTDNDSENDYFSGLFSD